MKPWMNYLIGAVVIAIIAVFVRSFAQVGVGQIVLSADSTVRFPKVKGQNLEGRTFNLPEDFEAKLNLVAIALPIRRACAWPGSARLFCAAQFMAATGGPSCGKAALRM